MLANNKHFIALLVIVVLALTVAAGTPGRRFVTGSAGTGTPAPPAPAVALPSLEASGVPDSGVLAPPMPDPVPPAAAGGELVLPPEEPPPPPKVCSTDAVTALNDEVRASLTGLLGTLRVPGESLNELIKLAAGCSDADPTTVMLDVALDFSESIPDLGLPFIDIPDLPAIPPLPADLLRPALAPLEDTIKDGCSQVATVALVLVIAPPAFQIPLAQSDIIQFLAPVSAFCAIFDDTGPA